MTTFNTYAEAKIANPESTIYEFEGYYSVFKGIGSKECNPADYCVTYNQCDEFKAGMIVLEREIVKTLNTVDASLLNTCKYDPIEREYWAKSYILRAAALEEKPKRMREEYVKWNFECAWHAIKAFEDGEKLYTKRSHKDFVLIDNAPDVLRFLYDLHDRIEAEVSEREEFIEKACEISKRSGTDDDRVFLGLIFDELVECKKQ